MFSVNQNTIIKKQKNNKWERKKGTEEPLEKTAMEGSRQIEKNIDAAEYKHVVLGLIFLKYISDAFEELKILN